MRVEERLQLFRVRQGPVLQADDNTVWYLHRSGVGLRVRHDNLQPRVVLDPIHARPLNHRWMLFEICESHLGLFVCTLL